MAWAGVQDNKESTGGIVQRHDSLGLVRLLVACGGGTAGNANL